MADITSAKSGNWDDDGPGGTWVGDVKPGVGDKAIIADGHAVAVAANQSCADVEIQSGGILTVVVGQTLAVSGTTVLAGVMSQFNIYGVLDCETPVYCADDDAVLAIHATG